MKIGFDAKRAAQNRVGLGNYSRFVLRILSQNMPQNEYHLYIPKPRRISCLKEIPTLPLLHLHFPRTLFWKRLSSLWRVRGVTKDIREDRIDIFHGLSNELPLNIQKSGCKSVVTIHDLIFIHYPQYYHWIDRKIYNYKFRRTCIKADRIIAVSEFTKSEIIRYFGTPAEKIDVVYQGCNPVFSQETNKEKLTEVQRKYRLPEQFILYVGSIEPRKNLLLVAKALKSLKERNFGTIIPVVAVGKRTSYIETIQAFLKENDLESFFRFYHDVSFEDLPSFYKSATIFVYPSRIEGFGIPALEAVSSGLPAICCKGSCLEEAGGEACLYVDPDDHNAMADCIEQLLKNDDLRMELIAKGKSHALNFTDERLCKDLMEVYKKTSFGRG